MRHSLLVLLVFILGPRATAQEGVKGVTLSADEKGVLDRTNAERKEAGLPPLKANAKLIQAAREHSANMARQGKLDHTLDGKSPADRVKGVGYRAAQFGENIAWNARTPADVISLWMNSPGHRANILNKQYTQIGVGVAVTAKGEKYWTQVFARPQ